MFLSCEKMWDMPIASDATDCDGALLKKIPHWAGNIVYAVVWTIFKLAFRMKVVGKNHLDATMARGGCLVVGNHASYADPAFLWIASRPRHWLRFMARENMFKNAKGLAGQIASRVGAFPVKRESADRVALKRASAMLKRGEAVGIFPEGTRRGRGSATPELHGGAAFIARMGKAPMLPAAVRNADKIKRKGQRMHFPQVTVVYGHPVYLEDFDFLPKEDRLDAAMWYVMRECYALLYDIDSSQVDMDKLFPASRNFSKELEGRELFRAVV